MTDKERLPLQEQIDALKEDMDSQWEITCSMFRNFERAIRAIMGTSDNNIEGMKILNDSMQGIIKDYTSKGIYPNKRSNKYD